MTLKSDKLAGPLEAWVPLCVHASRDQKSYAFARTEYLPDYYLHPVFVSLDARGEDIGADFRKYHEALTPEQLTALLNTAVRNTGKGLGRKDYANASVMFAEAKQELDSGGAAQAKKKLERLAMLEADCGLKRRSAAALAHLKAHPDYLCRLAGFANKAGATEVVAEIAEHLKENFDGLEPAAKAAALVESGAGDTTEDQDLLQACCDAFYAAAAHDYHEAASALEPMGAKAEALVELAQKMSKAGFSIGSVSVHKKGEKQADYDLRIIFSTGAAAVESVQVQYYFFTDKGTLYTGFEVFENLEAFRNYRCAAAVSGEMLGGETIANARAELYLNGKLVHAANLKEIKRVWWRAAEPSGILFYGTGESGWVSADLKVKSRGGGQSPDE